MYRHNGACFGHRISECKGACVGEEDFQLYNQRVEMAVAQLSQFKKPNFVILGKGREHTEKSIVWVENGRYVGFGFVDTETTQEETWQELREHIEKYQHNKDTQKIIQQYLETTQDKIVYF